MLDWFKKNKEKPLVEISKINNKLIEEAFGEIHKYDPDAVYVLWFKSMIQKEYMQIIRTRLSNLGVKCVLLQGVPIPEVYKFDGNGNGETKSNYVVPPITPNEVIPGYGKPSYGSDGFQKLLPYNVYVQGTIEQDRVKEAIATMNKVVEKTKQLPNKLRCSSCGKESHNMQEEGKTCGVQVTTLQAPYTANCSGVMNRD